MRIALLFALAVTLGLGLGLNSPSARAHANLVRSEPAENAALETPPSAVLLWFSEKPELRLTHIQVVDASGTRYDNDDLEAVEATNLRITLKTEMPDAVYTVIWKTVSTVDGHRTAGSFAFTVGEPGEGEAAAPATFESQSTAPGSLDAAVRWLGFAAMAVFIGAATFPALILRGSLRSAGGLRDRAERQIERVISWSLLVSLLAMIVATAGQLWVYTWNASGSVFSLDTAWTAVTDTRFGDVWLARSSLLAFVLIVLVLGRHTYARVFDHNRPLPWAWWGLLAMTLLIPATTSLNSHAAASADYAELWGSLDWLHLTAGGLWVGGLVQLTAVAPLAASGCDDRSRFLASIVPRFSALALPAVATIVATGVLQLRHQLGGITEVTESDYGYLLLAKVVLLLPLLALGAFNLAVVRRNFTAIARTSASSRTRISAWERRFRGAVGIEVAFLIAILVVTAVLTTNSPPSAAGEVNGSGGERANLSLNQKLKVDDLQIILEVDPGTVGSNDLSLFLSDLDGDFRPFREVILRFRYLVDDIGQTEAEAVEEHTTHFTLTTSQLSLPGEWEIAVIVRREATADARATFAVNVSE
jgi:copper transport protein